MANLSVIEQARQIQADRRAALQLNDELISMVPDVISHLRRKLDDGTITSSEVKMLLDRVPTPPPQQEVLNLPAGLSTADKIHAVAEQMANGEISTDAAARAVRALQGVIESQQLRLLNDFVVELSKPRADLRELTSRYLPLLKQFSDAAPVEIN